MTLPLSLHHQGWVKVAASAHNYPQITQISQIICSNL